MSEVSRQDWIEWLNHPCTKAFDAHAKAEWGAGGKRFEASVDKFADSREEDRVVLDQIRQIAVCRREILKLFKWPEEEVQRLKALDRSEPEYAGSRRGGL